MWLNKITKERWPGAPLARERTKGMRNPSSNLTPNPESHKHVSYNPGDGLQRDFRAQRRPLQNQSIASKPHPYKQPNANP